MAYTISKRFDFCASHELLFLPAEHPCHNEHGHNYSVTLFLSSDILTDAMVKDYRDLADFETFVKSFDHAGRLNTLLNSPNGEATTAENLAQMFFYHAASMYGQLVKAVEVKETEKTCARYEL